MNKASIVFFFFGYINVLSCCGNKLAGGRIRGAHLAYTIPVNTPDSNFVLKNTYDVFYYKDLILYKGNYQFDSVVNGKTMVHEQRSDYFVFHKDSLFGYNYHNKKRAPVDSMLQKISFQGSTFDTLANIRPDSTYSDSEGNLRKVYNIDKSPESFTIRFYYTKNLKGIAETFSKAMDNIKNMKLFKIIIEGHGARYQKINQTLPRRQYVYEMDALTLQNPEEIKDYFEKYARQ